MIIKKILMVNGVNHVLRTDSFTWPLFNNLEFLLCHQLMGCLVIFSYKNISMEFSGRPGMSVDDQ